MIVINNVKCKNFLSYGNVMTELSLSSHRATLIRGKNGHGKSVWMDMILYALYGKPYRDITKPQLVNSINTTNMLVEIEFSINSVQYRIVRGQKPTVFDIFKNGELIEQNAASKDYQDFLEKQILKINEKTFKQIAVLGSASYVPFMQLAAYQRRELIESILDIEIFSKMSTILKDRISSTKEEYSSIGSKLEIKKAEVISQQQLIKVIKNNTDERISELVTQREQLIEHYNDILSKIDEFNKAMSDLAIPVFDEDKFDEVNELFSSANRSHKALHKQISKIEELDTCPTCLQNVSADHVHSVSTDLSNKSSLLECDIKKHKEALDILTEHRDALTEYNVAVSLIRNELSALAPDLNYTTKSIARIHSSIEDIKRSSINVAVEEDKLKSIMLTGLSLLERKNVLSEEKHIQDVAAQLLKDTGIKTAIVKEYLPVLNQLINKYLAMFDFFVDFTLDESFNEVIKSRGRDVFSYSSFSEGEKRRIDFAILMAFRQLAAMKNSAKTNILIFDEIVDGAFDLEARGQFNDLICNIPNSNVIVISHADASTEAYDRVLHIEKRGDFSQYKIVE